MQGFKKHLFISLGGQGGKTLAELRKVMAQRHRDVASLSQQGVKWEFLSIDSSPDVWNARKDWTYFGKSLVLSNTEQLLLDKIGSADAIETLAIRPDISSWLNDRERIRGYVGGEAGIPGANQRRRFGRLLFAKGADQIRRAIFEDKVNSLTTNGANECCFHVFATLAGGTGSGGLIDLITMLRSASMEKGDASKFPIFLYLYVTSDDTGGADVGYFYQNQYAALRDLNALLTGSLKPPLLGDGQSGRRFAGNSPVNGVVLSTSLNSANYRLPIASQIRIIAESCFERIFSYASGLLNPTTQKSLTLEDIVDSFPGEPLQRPERSYRFSSVGMRRWEVPNEKIEELLAWDLTVSALRQMLTNNWRNDSGYVADPVTLEISKAQAIAASIEAHIAPKLMTPKVAADLKRKLTAELDRLCSEIGENKTVENKLEELEIKARELFDKSFETRGAPAYFRTAALRYEAEAEATAAEIDGILTKLWRDPVTPLSLGHVIEMIDSCRKSLRDNVEGADTGSSDSRFQQSRIARKREWEKLTFLSAAIGKGTALLKAHSRDISVEYGFELDELCHKWDRDFRRSLVGRLDILRGSYNAARNVLQQLLTAASGEQSTIDNDLRQMERQQGANLYEFNLGDLDQFRKVLQTHKDHQQSTANELRGLVANSESGMTLQRFKGSEDTERVVLDNGLKQATLQKAREIQGELESRGAAPKVLEASLMDRLQVRFAQDTQGLDNAAKEFVTMAATCVRIASGELQPRGFMSGGVGVSSMPRRLFLLGIPKHPYSETVKSALIASIPPGMGYMHDVYTHDDPSQLRLLLVDYWMAARFASVTRELAVKYDAAATAHTTNNVLYFANIDPEGEKGLRPELLMPNPDQMRVKLEAELWLGQQFENRCVEINERGVSLIKEEPDGLRPVLLGESVSTVVQSADIGVMLNVTGEVRSRLLALDESGRAPLRRQLEQAENEIKTRHGIASREFERWAAVRGELKKLLN